MTSHAPHRRRLRVDSDSLLYATVTVSGLALYALVALRLIGGA